MHGGGSGDGGPASFVHVTYLQHNHGMTMLAIIITTSTFRHKLTLLPPSTMLQLQSPCRPALAFLGTVCLELLVITGRSETMRVSSQHARDL